MVTPSLATASRPARLTARESTRLPSDVGPLDRWGGRPDFQLSEHPCGQLAAEVEDSRRLRPRPVDELPERRNPAIEHLAVATSICSS